MAQVFNRIEMDIRTKIPDIITAVQNDSNSRFLDVFLFDGSTPINLTGHEVRIYCRKPENGGEVFNNGEITEPTNGRCQFPLTDQTLAKVGYVEAQIVIYYQNVQVLQSQPFNINVVESLISNGSVESSNEYGALVVLYQNLYEAYDLMTTMVQNIGAPGTIAQELSLDTMWKAWEYMADNGKDIYELAVNAQVNAGAIFVESQFYLPVLSKLYGEIESAEFIGTTATIADGNGYIYRSDKTSKNIDILSPLSLAKLGEIATGLTNYSSIMCAGGGSVFAGFSKKIHAFNAVSHLKTAESQAMAYNSFSIFQSGSEVYWIDQTDAIKIHVFDAVNLAKKRATSYSLSGTTRSCAIGDGVIAVAVDGKGVTLFNQQTSEFLATLGTATASYNDISIDNGVVYFTDLSSPKVVHRYSATTYANLGDTPAQSETIYGAKANNGYIYYVFSSGAFQKINISTMETTALNLSGEGYSRPWIVVNDTMYLARDNVKKIAKYGKQYKISHYEKKVIE